MHVCLDAFTYILDVESVFHPSFVRLFCGYVYADVSMNLHVSSFIRMFLFMNADIVRSVEIILEMVLRVCSFDVFFML